MSMLVSGLLVLATGCDADGEAAGLADRVLIGEIDDDTFVAVITDADTVLAYVCDGTPATVGVATWFVGTHDGAGFSLTHTSGARLVGAIEGELVRGQYSFGDAALEYAVADADGEAGLHLGHGARLVCCAALCPEHCPSAPGGGAKGHAAAGLSVAPCRSDHRSQPEAERIIATPSQSGPSGR